MHNNFDAQLDRLLPAQHGGFSTEQADRIGFTDDMRRRRIDQGIWIAEDRGVYRHSAYRVTWEQKCACALLSRPGALLGGRTSAAAHGLSGFNKAGIVLDVLPAQSGRSNLATVRRTDLRQPRRVRGLAVQSIPVTLLEVAPTVSDPKLSVAVQDAIISGKLSASQLIRFRELITGSRRPGLSKFESVVDDLISGKPTPDSVLEARLHEILYDLRIPPFVAQVPFPWNPKQPHRVDVYIEEWRMLIEADGRRWHARLLTMNDDRKRDTVANRNGYLPLRFGWAEIQEPEEVRRTIIETAQAHGRLRTPGAA